MTRRAMVVSSKSLLITGGMLADPADGFKRKD